MKRQILMMVLNNDLDNQALANQQFRFSHSVFLTKNTEKVITVQRDQHQFWQILSHKKTDLLHLS